MWGGALPARYAGGAFRVLAAVGGRARGFDAGKGLLRRGRAAQAELVADAANGVVQRVGPVETMAERGDRSDRGCREQGSDHGNLLWWSGGERVGWAGVPWEAHW